MSGLITFVLCVESGPLEECTLYLLESLRRFGGRLSQSRVLLVKPRRGPSLRPGMVEKYVNLGAEIHEIVRTDKYEWKAFLNKHYAMAYAEDVCDTPLLCWLDSDLLIAREPSELMLGEDADFGASCNEYDFAVRVGDVGSPYLSYWNEVCKGLGLSGVLDLPPVQVQDTGDYVHMYWNSGVFVYRPETGLSRRHLEDVVRFFDMKVASKSAGFYFTQHVLGVTVVKSGVRYKTLSHYVNYTVSPQSLIPVADGEKVSVMHYHGSMWPLDWNDFLGKVRAVNSELASYVEVNGPLCNRSSVFSRLVNKVLGVQRKYCEKKYVSSCRVV